MGAKTSTLLIPLIAFVARVAWVLDIGKSHVVDQGHCTTLRGTEHLPGSEDISHWKDGVFFVSSGDILELTMHCRSKLDTGIYIVDIRDFTFAEGKDPNVYKAKVTEFPSSRAFHPHGMKFSNSSSTLYVINQVSVPGADSCIELFDVSQNPKDSRVPQLRWMRSLCTEKSQNFSFQNLGLNNIAEGNPNGGEVYVTQWLPYGQPLGGSEHKETFDDHLNYFKTVSSVIFTYPRDSKVFRCTFDQHARDGPFNCAPVVEGLFMPNGIDFNNDRTIMYLADSTTRTLYVFSRNVKTGELTKIESHVLQGAPDNVLFNSDTNEVLVATFTSTLQSLKVLHSGEQIPVPGIAMSYPVKPDGTLEQGNVILSQDGTKLSFLTVVNRYGPLTLHGSLGLPKKGILVCDDRLK